MVLREKMKLTQLHSFPKNFNFFETMNDFNRDAWEIAEVQTMRGNKNNKAYRIVHSERPHSYIVADEEAIREYFTNWTCWTPETIERNGRKYEFEYRTNYRIVQVRYKNRISSATCHKDDQPIFSVAKGISIAFDRALEKYQNTIHSAIENMFKNNKRSYQQFVTKEMKTINEKKIENILKNKKSYKQYTTDEKTKEAELFLKQYTRNWNKALDKQHTKQHTTNNQHIIDENKPHNYVTMRRNMGIDILEMPCYYTIVHFSTYDKKTSWELDRHFVPFHISEGIAQERKWQESLKNFYGTEIENEVDVLSAYGKNIFVVFTSQNTLLTDLPQPQYHKIVKKLLKEIRECDIHYIALWKKEVDNAFVACLHNEAARQNLDLTIAVAQ